MPSDSTVYLKALSRLREQIDEAERRGNADAGSAALATATASGAPSVRTVDVFWREGQGPAFFTDGGSGKAIQLRENPRAALCWYWPQTRFQAIVEGAAELLPEAAADVCWHSRPREKRLSSWASSQSRPLADEASLRRSQEKVRAQFRMDAVPRPAGWCAFAIVPDRIEIWQAGWQRLRAKWLYLRAPDGTWNETASAP